MAQYICERCGRHFIRKYCYQNHLNRKYPCKKDISCVSSEYISNDIKNNISLESISSEAINTISDSITELSDDLIVMQKDSSCNASSKNVSTYDSVSKCNKSKQLKKNHLCNKHNDICNAHSKKKASVHKYECEFCGFIFSRSDHLKRHSKDRCKEKLKKDEQNKILKEILVEMGNLKDENRTFQDILNRLEKENKTLKTKLTINTTNVNNSSINSNNTINIQVVAFGKEDIEAKLGNAQCKKILATGFRSVKNLIEHIHFNSNIPEFHNCYISNIRDKYAIVYDGQNWELRETDEVIEMLRDKKQLFLEEKFEEIFDSMDERSKASFNRFLDKKDDDETINSLKDEIKLLLYNKREVVKITRNKIKSKCIEA